MSEKEKGPVEVQLGDLITELTKKRNGVVPEGMTLPADFIELFKKEIGHKSSVQPNYMGVWLSPCPTPHEGPHVATFPNGAEIQFYLKPPSDPLRGHDTDNVEINP